MNSTDMRLLLGALIAIAFIGAGAVALRIMADGRLGLILFIAAGIVTAVALS